MSLHRQNPFFVLVVEDEVLVRDCTVALLEDAGLEVIEAANGEDALCEFQSHTGLTTVFTDVNMPSAFDGLCLVHKIHALRPAVQPIVTTGRGSLLKSELPAGGRFLAKPYSCDELAAMIKAA